MEPKLPAVIIFKERGGILGERVRRSLHLPSNVRVRSSTNGWMTATEYQHWLVRVFGKEKERQLLVIDSYKPHQSDESITMAKEHCNTDVIWGVHFYRTANGQVHQQAFQRKHEAELSGLDV